MRIKKILSVAVVLAMVMAVVPAFGITASAATAEDDVEALINSSSFKWYGDTTLSSGDEWVDQPWDSATVTSTNWNGWSGTAQMYSANTVLFLDGNNGSNGLVNAKSEIIDGTQTTEYVILTWDSGVDGINIESAWTDFKIMDGAGKFVDTFRYRSGNTEGINSHWAYDGSGHSFPDEFTDYTWDGTDGGVATKAKYYVAYINDTDGDGYTATYYYKESTAEAITKIGTKTYATGTVNGFGGFYRGNGSGPQRLYNFSVYAGEKASESSAMTIEAALYNSMITSFGNDLFADGYVVTSEKIELPKTINDKFSKEINVTWESSDEDTISSEGNVTIPEKEVKNVTLTATADKVKMNFKFVVFPGSRAGKEYRADGKEYKIDNVKKFPENIVASFEKDGAYSVDGWTSHVATQTTTNMGGSVGIGSSTYAIPDGKRAYGSRYPDAIPNGQNNYCTFETFFPVGEVGSYYLSFYIRKSNTADNNAKISLHFDENAAHNNKAPTGTEEQYTLVTTNVGQWEKKEYIFDVKEPGSIVFTAYNLGGYGGGCGLPGYAFDNFELYTATLSKAAKNTTVTTTADIDTFTLYNGFVFEGETESVHIPERQFYNKGKIYKVLEQDVSIDYATATATVESTVVQPNAATKMEFAVGDDISKPPYVYGVVGNQNASVSQKDADGTALDNYTTNFQTERKVNLTFKKPEVKANQVLMLYLPVGICRDNNNDTNHHTFKVTAKIGENETYSLNEAYCDKNDEVYDPPIELKFDVTDLLAGVQADNETTITFEAYDGLVGFVGLDISAFGGVKEGYAPYLTVEDGVNVTVENADGALITKNGTKMSGTTFTAKTGDTVRVYKGAAYTDGLAKVVVDSEKTAKDGVITIGDAATTIKVVKAPETTLTPELGWDGTKFTVDFTGEGLNAGDTVKVYGKNDADGNFTQIGTDTPVKGTDKYGVSVATEVTNRIYKAVVVSEEGLEGPESAAASVYSLVVKALASSELNGVDSKKTEAINDVIAKGGVYYTDTAFTSELQGILDMNTSKIDGSTITLKIKGDLFKLGIGFVLKDETIYFGSDDKTATGGKGDTAYDTMTITIADDGSTVVLKNSAAGTAEAITLSLDSVNIEFVETLIEELEAEGADAAQDFIPEL